MSKPKVRRSRSGIYRVYFEGEKPVKLHSKEEVTKYIMNRTINVKTEV